MDYAQGDRCTAPWAFLQLHHWNEQEVCTFCAKQRKPPAMIRHNRRRNRMTRDELIEDIAEGIRKALPENQDLDADALDAVTESVNATVTGACETIDECDDEDDESSLSEPTKQTE